MTIVQIFKENGTTAGRLRAGAPVALQQVD